MWYCKTLYVYTRRCCGLWDRSSDNSGRAQGVLRNTKEGVTDMKSGNQVVADIPLSKTLLRGKIDFIVSEL